MPNSHPSPDTRFIGKWKTGKTKTTRVPSAIEPQIKAIAICLDEDPSIADQVLRFAQSLVEQK